MAVFVILFYFFIKTHFCTFALYLGEIENEILKVLHDRKEPFTPIKATIVEPSIDMVNEYKRRVAADAAQQHDVTYDWRAQTLDGYLDRAENYGINFDFISTLHSIYYAVNMQASIKDLYDRLKPGGMMLIVVISGRFWDRLNNAHGVDDQELLCDVNLFWAKSVRGLNIRRFPSLDKYLTRHLSPSLLNSPKWCFSIIWLVYICSFFQQRNPFVTIFLYIQPLPNNSVLLLFGLLPLTQD